MELNHKESFFTDQLILNSICEYLTIADKINLAATCHNIRIYMSQILKLYLIENQLSLIQGKSIFRQLRFYFDRCLRITKIQNGQENYLSILQKPFKFESIIFFQVGGNYTVYINNHHTAFIFRTKVLIMNPKNQIPKYITLINVKNINCKAQKLIVLTIDGMVQIYSTDKNSQEIFLDFQVLQWSSRVPIDQLYGSYNYAVFISKTQSFNKVIKEICSIAPNQEDKQHQQNVIIVYNLLTRKYLLIKCPPQRIISCAVGSKQIYVVTEKYQCYCCQFDALNQGTIWTHLKEVQQLKDVSIVKIASGYNYFIALSRNLQKLQDWDNERVIKWLREIGFIDFIKIAQAEKVTGEKLIKMNRKYMENVLGITKVNMQQKFMMSITQHIEASHHHDKLYGWGKNQYGQLGSSSANFIPYPQKIKMPILKDTEHIDSIFCGWYQTYVRTQKGRLHHTIITIQKKKERDSEKSAKMVKNIRVKTHEESSEEEEYPQRKNSEVQQNNKFKYRKRKKTQHYRDKEQGKIKKNKKFQEEQRWIESSHGKAFFVQVYKDYIFQIQCPDHNILQHSKHKKLRTAKAILDKILWDPKLKSEQYKIGILDKDMGIIQLNTIQIQMFELKENRIKYFKRNNNIVWDRETKIDNLG